jgi:hypothetical protein
MGSRKAEMMVDSLENSKVVYSVELLVYFEVAGMALDLVVN